VAELAYIEAKQTQGKKISQRDATKSYRMNMQFDIYQIKPVL